MRHTNFSFSGERKSIFFVLLFLLTPAISDFRLDIFYHSEFLQSDYAAYDILDPYMQYFRK